MKPNWRHADGRNAVVRLFRQTRKIGRGHNSPPDDDETQRTREVGDYNYEVKPKYDKTCCVHAEWNAILDACKRYGKAI